MTEATNTRIQGETPPCGAAPPVLGTPTTAGAVGVLVGAGTSVFAGVGTDVFADARVGVMVGVFVGMLVGVLVGVFVGAGVGVSVTPTGAFDVSAAASGRVPKTSQTIIRLMKR